MTQRVYKFEPGQCVCLLGDFGAGSQKANVRKLSGTEMVLEATVPLKAEQFVYTTIKLAEGPSLALRGLVVTSAAGGILIQWIHSNPKEGDRIEAVLSEYTKARASAPAVQASALATPAAHEATPAHSSPQAAVGVAVAAKVTATISADAVQPAPPSSRAPLSSQAPPLAHATAKHSAPKALHPGEESTEPSDGDALGVDAKLRKKAKRVLSRDLASRVDTVQVVNMGMIRSLVQEAVDESLALHAAHMSEAEKKHLMEEAEASFAERLSLFKAEKSGLEVQLNALQDSLRKAQGLLVEERGKVLSAHQFTVSDAGMAELEQRLGRLLDHAVKVGSAGKELEDDMRAIVAKLLDDERDKIREQAQQAQNDRIQLLERKVQRLAASLESVESERDLARERAFELESSGGMSLRNVMKSGLDDGDPRKNRKLGLLKEIYKFNQEVRQKLIAEGRMPERKASLPEQSSVGEHSPATEQDHVDERRLAKELGITRSTPVQSALEPSSAKDEEPEGVESTEIPVLASGSDVDPDDMPWEPPPSTTSVQQQVAIKRLGSGS